MIETENIFSRTSRRISRTLVAARTALRFCAYLRRPDANGMRVIQTYEQLAAQWHVFNEGFGSVMLEDLGRFLRQMVALCENPSKGGATDAAQLFESLYHHLEDFRTDYTRNFEDALDAHLNAVRASKKDGGRVWGARVFPRGIKPVALARNCFLTMLEYDAGGREAEDTSVRVRVAWLNYSATLEFLIGSKASELHSDLWKLLNDHSPEKIDGAVRSCKALFDEFGRCVNEQMPVVEEIIREHACALFRLVVAL